MLDITARSITGILLQFGVSNQVIGGNGKHIAEGLKVTACIRTTLPLPLVVGIATELAKADQIDAATALEVELTAPLVQNLVEGVAVALKGMSTATDGVKRGYCIGRSDTATHAGQRLSIVQVSFGHTHVEQV